MPDTRPDMKAGWTGKVCGYADMVDAGGTGLNVLRVPFVSSRWVGIGMHIGRCALLQVLLMHGDRIHFLALRAFCSCGMRVCLRRMSGLVSGI